ncbi:hypothetical protein [Weissella confusa]|uniref:hypothetical protein n=1 Tax=Weissella confusa TaxID=1583 RepID=UPI0010818D64|nr:hypothetical protein [Weissella confusa]MBJ7654022.1 hypothetical protein [Weissella confusa]TGE42548.1 hypothetical protein C6P24_06340 [Weissella confusa]
MKTVKILGDTLNKVADTSTIFDFRLWNSGQAQDVTGKAVSFVIANDSGYLFDVPAVVDGNVVSLDFSNELLKQLTPDTYHMEVSVANKNGDVEVYPSEGTIDFTVGKNLHSTQGKLVPQITFDTVLRSVDEKITAYTKTIAKGDKGDTGPQGPKGDMDLSQINVGSRNYILNSKRTLSGTTPSVTSWVNTSIPISAFSNNIFTLSVQIDYDNVTVVTGSNRAGLEITAAQVRPDGTNATRFLGVWHNAKVGESFHGRVSATFDMRGVTLKSQYTPNYWGGGLYIQGITATNISVSNPKLEIGNVPTDWTPAPEDVDSTYVKDTRVASGITDFNLVIGKNWSGKWYKTGVHWSNEPAGASAYLQFEYTPGDTDRSGILEIRDWTANRYWIRTVSAGTWSNWVELANDANVVHKTGTETIAGDKALVGNTTLATTTILAGNYGLRVTPSGFQKTTDGKTWVSANI